jgi:hypothetical protein
VAQPGSGWRAPDDGRPERTDNDKRYNFFWRNQPFAFCFSDPIYQEAEGKSVGDHE